MTKEKVNEDYVKGFFPGESMWVKVIEKNENELIGVLDNIPVYDSVKNSIENGEDIPEIFESVYSRGKLHDASLGDKVKLIWRQEREDFPYHWYFEKTIKEIKHA